MPERPLFPGVSLIIGGAKAALIKARPSATEHVSKGNYALPFIGWRGQFAEARAALVKQAKRSRLKQAEGPGLRELARDHYDLELAPGPSYAVGEAVLVRRVVHVVREEPIQAADARDEATLAPLLEEFVTRLNAHLGSVFDAATGAGAHLMADGSSLVFAGASMADLCATAHGVKRTLNRHVTNQQASNGQPLRLHTDTDDNHAIGDPDVAPSGPGPFSAQAPAAQQKLLLFVNACKRAIDSHFALEARGGSIRAGTVFSVQGDSKQVPAVDPAEYVSAQDMYARPGCAMVAVPIVAVQSGPHANLPQWASGGQKRLIRVRDALFDHGSRHAFELVELRAAGGAVDHVDDAVRKAARANWIGRHGPVAGSLVAGCLHTPGPRDVVVREDLERGRAVVYVVDQRWAYSGRWHDALFQQLKEQGRIGFGCSVVFGKVLNRLVRVEVAVKVRSSADLAAAPAMTERLRATLRAYFDARPDWWVWDLAAVRATCTQADSRILGCPHAVVRDEGGRPIPQPTAPKPGEPLVHWWFAGDSLDASFLPPT
jgi:hypothetical protein